MPTKRVLLWDLLGNSFLAGHWIRLLLISSDQLPTVLHVILALITFDFYLSQHRIAPSHYTGRHHGSLGYSPDALHPPPTTSLILLAAILQKLEHSRYPSSLPSSILESMAHATMSTRKAVSGSRCSSQEVWKTCEDTAQSRFNQRRQGDSDHLRARKRISQGVRLNHTSSWSS